MCCRIESQSIVRSTHPATVLAVAGVLLLVVCAAIAGPRDIFNPAAASEQKKAVAISTNATTSVTYATLNAAWLAAGNKAAQDAVIAKLFAKLAGIESIEVEQKKKDKANAGKGKVSK